MIVTLDGNRVDCDYPAGVSLENVINDVRSGLDADALVVSVAVNGQTFDQTELTRALSGPLQADDQVDFESASRSEVTATALRSVGEQLQKAGQLQPRIADQIDAGDVADAVRQLGEFINTWQATQQVIVQCSGLLGRNLTEAEYDGMPVAEHVTGLVAKLREMRDALDARDMVLVSDLLHYELPDLCSTWYDLLQTLAGQVQSRSL